MKTLLFVFLLFLVPVVLKAQRVQIGFNAGPTAAHRFLRTDSEAIRSIFADERVILRYSVGLDVALRVGANGQIGTGLLYGRRGYGQRFQLTDENGQPLPRDLILRSYLDYLDVPLWGKYRFGVRERRSFYALAGFNNSFFLGQRAVVKNNTQPWPNEPSPAYRPYIPGAMIGLGIRRAVGEKLSVEAGPQATLQLQHPLEGEPILKRFLYAAGLNCRVAYDL